MGKTPWTPGPWRVEFDPENMVEFEWYVAALDQTTVAAMYLNASEGDGGIDGKANARLIAKAPAMAEFLLTVRDYIDDAANGAMVPEVAEMAKGDLARLDEILSEIRGDQ